MFCKGKVAVPASAGYEMMENRIMEPKRDEAYLGGMSVNKYVFIKLRSD